ncbi:MAG: LUD domain-containing protein [Pseudomonadota bacterium]
MSSDARSEILARVRYGSLGQTRNEAIRQLQALGPGPSAVLPDADVAVAFLSNVLRNRGSVDIADSRSAAVAAIGRYLYERFRSRKLVAGDDPRLAAMPWREGGLLPRFGLCQDGDDACLSYARAAVAETGSVLLATGRANPASNNLLAEDHVVLVDHDDLEADLNAAWRRAQAGGSRARAVHIISGPSSTADIAKILVRGAHGPRNWHVILCGAELTADQLALARESALA